jgi:hypothetical protein
LDDHVEKLRGIVERMVMPTDLPKAPTGPAPSPDLLGALDGLDQQFKSLYGMLRTEIEEQPIPPNSSGVLKRAKLVHLDNLMAAYRRDLVTHLDTLRAALALLPQGGPAPHLQTIGASEIQREVNRRMSQKMEELEPPPEAGSGRSAPGEPGVDEARVEAMDCETPSWDFKGFVPCELCGEVIAWDDSPNPRCKYNRKCPPDPEARPAPLSEAKGSDPSLPNPHPLEPGEAPREGDKVLEDLLTDAIRGLDEQRTRAEAAEARVRELETTLRSIAGNSCCDPCQEAKRVAEAALRREAPASPRAAPSLNCPLVGCRIPGPHDHHDSTPSLKSTLDGGAQEGRT